MTFYLQVKKNKTQSSHSLFFIFLRYSENDKIIMTLYY